MRRLRRSSRVRSGHGTVTLCNAPASACRQIGDGIGHGVMNQAGASVTEREIQRCTRVNIDLLGPADWPILRSARLAALHDSPDAFVATLAAEARRTPDEWIASIKSSTWAVARDGVEVLGLACLAAPVSGARHAHFIESVWVRPVHRRQGLVRKMLQRLEGEARAEDVDYLQLWVLETNELAPDAYRKLDFHPSVPDVLQDSMKPGVRERLMVKQLL